MYRSTIYHSNLSDQSARKLVLGLGLDSKLHYFRIFTKNNENEHLSSASITTGNIYIFLKERTQTIKNKIKITYSRSARA